MRREKRLVQYAALMLVLSVGVRAAEPPKEPTLLKPGTLAPTFMLPNLDGSRLSLRTWCGDTLANPYTNRIKHTVILSFWATYCKPCQKEIPQLITFAQNHKSDPIKVFCVSMDKEGATIVAPFVKEKGYDIPILLDQYCRTAERYGVKSVPALFVIGPNGVIQYSCSGFDDNTNLAEKLEPIVAAAVAGKVVSAKAVDVAGEVVAVQEGAHAPAAGDNVTPQQRWRAVAQVECGGKIDDVAKEYGVSADVLHGWYEDLKRAAVAAWSAPKK
jgi:thiol-disulfide isomerase/thioredoxin